MSDKEIIDLLFARDEKALALLSQKYEKVLLSLSTRILSNPEDARECLNDTYQKIWESIPPTVPDNLSAYVIKIIRNLSFNRIQKENAQKRGNGENTLILDEISEMVSGKESAEEEWEEKELSGEINRFLSTLSREKRIIFVKRYFFGKSIREIAKEMGISENKAGVSLTRTRTKLKEYLHTKGYIL